MRSFQKNHAGAHLAGEFILATIHHHAIEQAMIDVRIGVTMRFNEYNVFAGAFLKDQITYYSL
ncbi:hypothetical protein L0337_25480 [candidate division KSB1 bacterium]|nr:hypothetical protein [candidate division KSB1 bacterium]